MCEDYFQTFPVTVGKQFFKGPFLDSKFGVKSCCPVSVLHWTWKTWIRMKEKFRWSANLFLIVNSFLFFFSGPYEYTRWSKETHLWILPQDFYEEKYFEKPSETSHRFFFIGLFRPFSRLFPNPIRWGTEFSNRICYNVIQYIILQTYLWASNLQTQNSLVGGGGGTPVHPQNVGFQNVRFQNVWFQNVQFQNVMFIERQVYKTSGLQNVRFQNVWFQNVQFKNFIYLLNKRDRNCQVCIAI